MLKTIKAIKRKAVSTLSESRIDVDIDYESYDDPEFFFDFELYLDKGRVGVRVFFDDQLIILGYLDFVLNFSADGQLKASEGKLRVQQYCGLGKITDLIINKIIYEDTDEEFFETFSELFLLDQIDQAIMNGEFDDFFISDFEYFIQLKQY